MMLYTEFKRHIDRLAAVQRVTLREQTVEAWYEELRGYQEDDLDRACRMLVNEDRMPPLSKIKQLTSRTAKWAKFRVEDQLGEVEAEESTYFGRLAAINAIRLAEGKKTRLEAWQTLNRLMQRYKVTPQVPLTGDEGIDAETWRKYQDFKRREALEALGNGGCNGD